MSRSQSIRDYLGTLITEYVALEAERQALLDAAARITAIQAEKQDLISDAQTALDLYNSIHGTSHTLQEVRTWFDGTLRGRQRPA